MMNDLHSRWTDQFSEYLDGSLGAEDRRAVEEHLAGCARCAAVLSDLRGVVDLARSLGDVPPARDLWPDIAARLWSSPEERPTEVIPLHTGHTGHRPQAEPRGVYMSRRQLAAAAVIVAMASAAATWALGPGIAVRPVGTPLPMPAAVSPAATEEGPPPAMADELAHLEATLNAARDRLDPTTVRILEKNLDVIDRAIQDSRKALATDPANPFLREHLDRAYQDKVDYLREAAGIAEWAG
ncbi:MAG: zf-HC2 domain-containing protein [Gemmatimonadetes bacterium]|nr:zf-HC2 domain-containing protein [Gemmatimonadota bacterium]